MTNDTDLEANEKTARPRLRTAAVASAVLACTLVACGAHGTLVPGTTLGDSPADLLQRATTPIQHVVIIVQENRSFDNLFDGYPGANTKSSGKNSHGQTIALAPIPLEAGYDIEHSYSTGFNVAWDKGKMDHFDLESVHFQHGVNYANPQYGYVPQSETAPYWSMAQQYVLDDAMFASDIDGSFVAHQYLIAGQANSEVNYPIGAYWGCQGGPNDVVYQLTQSRTISTKAVPVCQNYQTLADELDHAGVSWKTYAPSIKAPSPSGLWNGYQAIKHIYYGAQWKEKNISPETKIITDIAAGKLSAVTWVIPEFSISDHPESDTNWGPGWVANVVNAVGKSKFWNTSAIFVLWDDWGGWYDHVPPKQLDYDGLGFRVPMICISPYALKGQVSHKAYEFGSVLRFVENNFGLGQLAASDTRATPADSGCMNYSQQPRPFVAIPAALTPAFYENLPPPHLPPDEQ